MNTSPQRIAPDFQPCQSVLELANGRGMDKVFIAEQLPEFIFYYERKKVARKDWQRSFWNWLKNGWSYKAKAEKKTSRTNPQANVEWEKPVIKVAKSRPSLKDLIKTVHGG